VAVINRPDCFFSNPSLQSQAENSCNDCQFNYLCLPEIIDRYEYEYLEGSKFNIQMTLNKWSKIYSLDILTNDILENGAILMLVRRRKLLED
jgi:hypothetical protein